MKRAVVPGTFDPITAGHVDVIKRASQIFDDVVVAVAQSVKKNPMFDLETRVSLATQAVADLPNVSVISFDGLLVDCVRELDAHVVVKGLRAITPKFMYLSSSIIREMASMGGNIKGFVPPCVEDALKEYFADAYKKSGK